MQSTTSRSVLTSALLTTWLVWGSTFLAIHVAVASMPPLLMMGTRFILAGALTLAAGMFLARRAGRRVRPTRIDWRNSTLIGTGLVTIGMGATAWAATRLPTGVAALLVASAPLWVAALGAVALRTRLTWVAGLGLLVGMLGVGVLVMPGGGSSGIDVTAALVLVAANAAWAASTIFATRTPSPHGLLVSCGMQLLTGGALLTIVGLVLGEGARLELGAITPGAGMAWLYLVTFGSIIGFLAYGWLLERTSASVASTHAFVNPLVAVALGALLLGEHVDARTALAAGGVVAAVILLLVAERGAAAAPSRGGRAARLPVRVAVLGRSGHGRGRGWTPAPTPAFAARRVARPDRVTDGMDALAIDDAFEGLR